MTALRSMSDWLSTADDNNRDGDSAIGSGATGYDDNDDDDSNGTTGDGK